MILGRNVLMICNTPYQIFVSTWLKMTLLKQDRVDIIVSNHMNNSDKIAENIKKTSVYENVFHVESKNFVPQDYLQTLKSVFSPFGHLEEQFSIHKRYDVLFASNIDRLARLLFHAIKNDKLDKRANKNLEFYIYEDGIATYSRHYEKAYDFTKKTRRLLFWYKHKKMYYNCNGIYLFDKDAIMWQPNTLVLEIPKIDVNNIEFKNIVNTIFDYQNANDVYDKKYIFMEESFFADGCDVNDVEVVQQISNVVGRENIMVKIHPRNPINRFKELGYKTNENTHIPWEVIVLNQDMSEKILLTFASTAVLNPLRLFGQNTKVYSLYKCFKKVPAFLEGDLWKATEYSYKKYYPTIEILNNIEEKFKI